MSKLSCKQPLRLREKICIQGASHLADAELLAILISSGNQRKTCLQLAYELLDHFGDLRSVLNASQREFQQIHGLGEVRYAQLQAAKEICKRSDLIALEKSIQLNSSSDTHQFLKRVLRDKKNETVAALFLDNQHRLIAFEELFQGTIHSAFIHPRPIVERLLHLNAAALILAHNHPSGHCQASKEDILVTRRLKKALELVDARLLDHLIIADNEVFSVMSDIHL